MTEKPYRPRLSVELTEEQQRDLVRLVPWGVKNQLFSTIVDDVIRCLKEHGQIFLAAVLTKAVKLEDYSSLKMGEKNDNS